MKIDALLIIEVVILHVIIVKKAEVIQEAVIIEIIEGAEIVAMIALVNQDILRIEEKEDIIEMKDIDVLCVALMTMIRMQNTLSANR